MIKYSDNGYVYRYSFISSLKVYLFRIRLFLRDTFISLSTLIKKIMNHLFYKDYTKMLAEMYHKHEDILQQ